MTDVPSSIRLNASQRRHYEVLFSRLEDSLWKVEILLQREAPHRQVLSVTDDDVPVSFRETAPHRLLHLREMIARLARTLDLRPRTQSRRRLIQAMLTAEAVRIEDSLGAQMRGYGLVDPSVPQHLDPQLVGIAHTLNALAASLKPDPRTIADE